MVSVLYLMIPKWQKVPMLYPNRGEILKRKAEKENDNTHHVEGEHVFGSTRVFVIKCPNNDTDKEKIKGKPKDHFSRS